MAKKRVAILGATGMLGSIMLDSFVQSREFDMIATCRKRKEAKLPKHQYPKVAFRRFDAETTGLKGLSEAIKGAQWVVNAIGVTKPHIHDDNAEAAPSPSSPFQVWECYGASGRQCLPWSGV